MIIPAGAAGTYTETGNKINLDIWENSYKVIRQTSIFLGNVDMNKELSEAEVIDMKGQAHFLRAYFYWVLVRTFGPVLLCPMKRLIIRNHMITFPYCVIRMMSVLIISLVNV